MIDELALSALFELGKLAVAGVSSLVSSGKPTAAETQGPTKLSPDQTEALGKLKELQEQERAEVRKQLLKKLADEKVLDARSIETLDEAREAAEIQDHQAKKVEQELLDNSVLLPQQLLPPRINSRKSIIPEAPYFDSLREFERQMKPFETKTNELIFTWTFL